MVKLAFKVLLLLLVLYLPPGKAQDKGNHQNFTWEEFAALPEDSEGRDHPGLAGAFSGVSNDALIIAGGANFPNRPPWDGGRKHWWKDIYILEKTDSAYHWFHDSNALDKPVAYGISVTLPYGLLCIGGTNESGIVPDVFLLHWDRNDKKVARTKLGELPPSFEAVAAAEISGSLYVCGIIKEKNHFIRIGFQSLLHDTEHLWEELPSLPGPPRRLTLYAAQSNGRNTCFYLFGGRSELADSLTLLNNAFVYDPLKRTWSEISEIQIDGKTTETLMGAPALSYGANNIFIFGGDNGALFKERFKLEQSLRTASEGNDSIANFLKTSFKSHPGFETDIIVYNTVTNTYRIAGNITGNAPVTTNAVLWQDKVILVSGEIRPGVRTPKLLQATLNKQRGSFGAVNYTLLVIYLVVLVIIGIYFSFRQKSTTDYFKGGGRVPWWAAGLSVFGTALSAITFMAIPAKTYTTDWSYFFYNMSVIPATLVVVVWFIPFYRRLDVTTAYEYLERRFNLVVRLFGSASFIIFQIGRIAIVLYLPAIALSLVTGIDLHICIITMGLLSLVYTLVGGIEAVIWTDVIQVIVLMGGTILSLVIIFFNLEGNISELLAEAYARQKFNLFDLRFSWHDSTFWVVMIGGFFANLVTYSSDQTMVQRYLTTRDENGAVKTAWTNAILVIPSTLLFFSVGTALFLYYSQFPQRLDPFAQDNDAIFPWYIIQDLPPGVSGLLIAGLFSAAMSSLSSSMNSSATAFTTDFYQRFKRNADAKQSLRMARISTLICGLLGTFFAIWMSTSEIISLWDQFSTLLGLFTGGLGGLFLLGIFSRKANGKGAIVGLIASSLIQYAVSMYADIHLFLFAAVGFLSCFLIGHVASIIIPDKENEEGKSLTIYNRLFKR